MTRGGFECGNIDIFMAAERAPGTQQLRVTLAVSTIASNVASEQACEWIRTDTRCQGGHCEHARRLHSAPLPFATATPCRNPLTYRYSADQPFTELLR
jgi:hypothetical protein